MIITEPTMLAVGLSLSSLLLSAVLAQSSLSTPSGTLSTAPPTTTIATAVPSPSSPLASPLPSQVALPPKQAWCPSQIFCAGSLLQTVNIADAYADPKTIVDKPTSKSAQAVLADFQNISSGTTYGQVVNFLNSDFKGEGLELEALTLTNFNANPSFLNNVSDPLVKAFSQTVHSFWTQLIRETNSSTLCGSSGNCESSLIPLNHTFVVPGGRFREQYYWDSFWIVEGLIESELFDIANDTLQNFMDELDTIGFIPNGGRIYYLNRSQPPLFIQMLARYITASGDTSILTRALPLAEKELKWWDDNRSVAVKSPFTNQSYTMHRYAVNNTAPRPESYLTDYNTANAAAQGPTLNETQRSALYAELASGAETGWDYTVRWFLHGINSTGGLRDLNVRSTVPVDLNSILYKNHLLLAGLYGNSSANQAAVQRHQAAAAALKSGLLDLCWDSSKVAFYDFNLATNTRNDVFSVAAFYPFWNGIIPDQILADPKSAFAAFSSVNMVLNRYNGTFPTTFIDSGLQWDAPNAWPPHQYIVLQALRSLPENLTADVLPTNAANQSSFYLIPPGQLAISEAQLPGQPVSGSTTTGVTNATGTGPSADINKLNGTVVNGGNATSGEGWAHALQRQLANRYIASALCSWHATGGSISGILPRLSDAELNVTQSQNNTGNMFEKFSNIDVDSAGRGGEYTVQAGFGWTNGVVLWVASNYGGVLVPPQCPDLLTSPLAAGSSSTTGGSGGKTNVAVLGKPCARVLGLSAFALGLVAHLVL